MWSKRKAYGQQNAGEVLANVVQYVKLEEVSKGLLVLGNVVLENSVQAGVDDENIYVKLPRWSFLD